MDKPSKGALNALTPEKWKRPEDVMKLHKLRVKKKALQARMNRTETVSTTACAPNFNSSLDSVFTKRKNPFSSKSEDSSSDQTAKRIKPTPVDEDTACDTTLFKLLNLQEGDKNAPLNFSNILSRITAPQTVPKLSLSIHEGAKEPPVDWTLRTKLRFMAQKPFPWNTTLRTCEEASGITGFVRCIDSSNSSLDTSPNSKFHQCCLLWQHPSLPWLELYPRQSQRKPAGSSTPPPAITSHPTVKDSLQRHWADSFRSLYQLLRARQCPFFYLVSNTFTCLFRAAGICGYPHTHVLITPTTRGFRKSLRDQEIEFRMPLRPQDNENEDTGYETLDATSQSPESSGLEEADDELDDGDGEEAEQWLESMGVEAAEIKRISNVQAEADIGKDKKMDRTPESLVLVEDTEAHVLFNLLLNSKSCVATTGPLAGVPPTLLAPVAFHGSTLRALRVRESKVQVGKDSFYSMEMVGPVLPSCVQQLCNLLQTSSDQFSLTLASHETTKAFTTTGHYTTNCPLKDNMENSKEESAKGGTNSAAFCQEGLSDGGLPASILKRFCTEDVSSIQQFDSLKHSNGIYSWS